MSAPITFLLPPEYLNRDLPQTLQGDWSKCGGSCYGTVYVTYVALRERQIDCRAAAEMPEHGIVIAHPLTLARYKPFFSKRHYVVCWQQDYARCDWAHLHIVMNSSRVPRASLKMQDRLLWPGPRHLLHYIPEAKLIPRSPSRGGRFENLGFMGEVNNLIPEIRTPQAQQQLAALGCRLCIHDAEHTRADYSDVDAVLAIRPPQNHVAQKSPHKLWNAWRAGVPAILGPEPGFSDFRRSDLDFLEARNVEEALAAIQRLKQNTELRRAMVENGRKRAGECSVETLVAEWKAFLDGPLQNYAAEWFAGSAWRLQAFRVVRSLRIALRKIRQSRVRGK